MMEDVFNKFNYEFEEGFDFIPDDPQIKNQEVLGLSCIPQLGQYGDEYHWLTPTMVMRCFPNTVE